MTTSKQPLAGLRVLVTRARDQSEQFRVLFEGLGAQVIELSVIEISKPDDFSDLDRALKNLASYQWMVLASSNAVEYTLARAQTLGVEIGSITGLKLAAIGPSTAARLIKNGLAVDFTPSRFVAEEFVQQFPGYPGLQGTKVFWPKTNIGRTVIADQLTAAGAEVDTAIAYLTGLPHNHSQVAARLVKSLTGGTIDVITLASAQSARNFATLLKEGLAGPPESPNQVTGAPTKLATFDGLLSSVKIAVIGPATAEATRQALGRVDIEAAEFTLDGLTDALLASLKFG